MGKIEKLADTRKHHLNNSLFHDSGNACRTYYCVHYHGYRYNQVTLEELLLIYAFQPWNVSSAGRTQRDFCHSPSEADCYAV